MPKIRGKKMKTARHVEIDIKWLTMKWEYSTMLQKYIKILQVMSNFEYYWDMKGVLLVEDVFWVFMDDTLALKWSCYGVITSLLIFGMNHSNDSS